MDDGKKIRVGDNSVKYEWKDEINAVEFSCQVDYPGECLVAVRVFAEEYHQLIIVLGVKCLQARREMVCQPRASLFLQQGNIVLDP